MKYCLVTGILGNIKYWDGHEWTFNEYAAKIYTKDEAYQERDVVNHGVDVYVCRID